MNPARRHLAILSACLLVFALGQRPALAQDAASPEDQMTASLPAAPLTKEAFSLWRDGFRPRALAAGIPAATFDAAFSGLGPDQSVIEKDRNQNEFTRQIWDYLDTAVSADRIAGGKAACTRQAGLLARLEAGYGVDSGILCAIWGLETAYGAVRGDIPVIRSLATLAAEGRRRAFFEAQLIAALQILASGAVPPARFTGSWAGATGHTQFMPASYLAFAVSASGAGRPDIWSDDPADALASTAAYLARNGWVRGQPWGLEVRLPPGFDFALSGEGVVKPVAEWQALGVAGATGQSLPDGGPASVLVPAGFTGAAFLIFRNFHVLETYNTADAYVIAVGHLADRIAGGPPLAGTWPRGDRALGFAEKQEMQRLLAARGFDPGTADGIMGPNTIAAIRAWQKSAGRIPDGYGSLEVLHSLRN
jgi:membrane-bound lytic murein transglycosylase B